MNVIQIRQKYTTEYDRAHASSNAIVRQWGRTNRPRNTAITQTIRLEHYYTSNDSIYMPTVC